MFLYRGHANLSHKQCSHIGFVLAILSVLVTCILVYIGPLLFAWLHHEGIYKLDLFLLSIGTVIFLAIQGLLLFGFPLFYAHDKKDHMTGFQILIYALMWILLMTLLVLACSLTLF